MNLSKRTKVTVVSPAAAAAQTEIDSSIVDMAGYDGVCFLCLTGDVTTACVLTLTAEQNVLNSASGMATLTGSATFTAGATDADSKVLMLDVNQPRERYVRANLTRTVANAVVGGILALQYSAGNEPTTHDASVIASAMLTAPAEA